MLHLNVIAETSPDASPDDPPFQISVGFDGYDPNATSLVLADDGPYDAPYDALTNRAYNAQYGWLATGRWGVPAGYTLYVEQLDATDGLEAYEGGLGADVGGQGVVFGPPHALTPIFDTAGTASRWAWGTRETGLRMTHHWYATDTPGPHAATYRLYFEHNDTGLLHPDYEPGEITLLWQNPLTELAGDFNASGSVEQGDLNLVLNNWGVDASRLAPPGWLTQWPDDTVDQEELNAVLNNWGSSASPSLSNAPIPEPVLGWILLSAGAWIRRRANA
ncbi:MAG: hypothetical protein AAF916_05635 [Planctomycetota bacterium]